MFSMKIVFIFYLCTTYGFHFTKSDKNLEDAFGQAGSSASSEEFNEDTDVCSA